jgi:rSAM/selenodomain-associated transferase 1
MVPFELERQYRVRYRSELLDLSTSTAPPPTLRDLGVASLTEVGLGYTPGGGSLELRTAIAALYRDLNPSRVLVTAGAIEAIRAVGMATVRPGERVLVQSHSYAAMEESVRAAGGVPVPWSVLPGEPVTHQGSGHTRPSGLGFINSPHGPTGALVPGLASFPGRLVVDEVYRPLGLYGAVKSALDTTPGAVVIGDLSKPLGLGGLRIGWIACRDAEVVERCADALDYLSGSVSVLSDNVAIQAMRQLEPLISERLARARENLSTLGYFVERHRELLDWTPPQAGLTACVRLRSGPPPDAFFDKLQDRGVFLLPGSAFGRPDCLRIGLGLASGDFDYGLGVLSEALSGLPTVQEPVTADGDVILFTKLPFVGHGKSRLAAGVGPEAAAELAKAFLVDSLAIADAEGGRLFLSVDSRAGVPELASAYRDATVLVQRGGDQRERLHDAFVRAFATGARKPVLIGSDSPTLPAHLIGVAHNALGYHDVVIGPAVDGGYYAIGMNAPHPEVFADIDWGSSHVFEQTMTRAAGARLSVFVLPPWYDIDTEEDLARAASHLATDSATHRALSALGRAP